MWRETQHSRHSGNITSNLLSQLESGPRGNEFVKKTSFLTPCAAILNLEVLEK